MSSPRTLKIASRASALALWQARYVAGLIQQHVPQQAVEIVEVSTLGDRDRTGPLAQFGGMGVFTREVQQVVLAGDADLAVHSLKDLPTEAVPGLELAGIPPRETRTDALILRRGEKISCLEELPVDARIGTGSVRRQAQLLHWRRDLQPCEIRGNVDTRLKKLDAGEYAAIVLAVAGLTRLQWQDRISLVLEAPVMYPAVGQGALGIECRADDAETIGILGQLTHAETRIEVLAERACLAQLRAGCHAPVGVWAAVRGDQLRLEGVVLSPDGRQRFVARTTGPVESPRGLGIQLAERLASLGAANVLQRAD